MANTLRITDSAKFTGLTIGSPTPARGGGGGGGGGGLFSPGGTSFNSGHNGMSEGSARNLLANTRTLSFGDHDTTTGGLRSGGAGSSKAQKAGPTYVKRAVQGVFQLYSDLIITAIGVPPVAALLTVLWEALQLWSFMLSPSKPFPWHNIDILSSFPSVLQVISCGFYLPNQLGLETAQFITCLSLVYVTAWLFAQNLVKIIRADAEPQTTTTATWPIRLLRLLLLLLTQAGFMPIMTQLVAAFRCNSLLSFLEWHGTQCFGTTHVILAILSAIAIPIHVLLAVFTILVLFSHEPVSRDPFARPHGRITLAMLLMKCAVVIIFSLDRIVATWALAIIICACSAGTLYCYAIFLPYHWQILNQFGAAMSAVVTWNIAPLALALARNNGELAGWVMWFGCPLAFGCGWALAALQWNFWLQQAAHEQINVFRVELKSRRLTSSSGDLRPSAEALDAADALWAQALKTHTGSVLLHMCMAQYLQIYRQNQHLERSHLKVLELSVEAYPDQVFFAFHRRRCGRLEEQARDRLNVYERFLIEKHRSEARQLSLQARKLQLAFWTELVQKMPSATRLAETADELWQTMKKTEFHYDSLLHLNPTSVAAMRDYAQFLQEVANHHAQAAVLMEDADDTEAALARAQRQHVDVDLLSTKVQLDMSAENLSVITISHEVADLGRIIEANPVALQMFGYARRELLGRNVNVILPEPIASVHTAWLQNYLQTGISTMLNTTRSGFGLHRNGYIFPLVQTTRATDTGFNAVQQTLTTNDYFLFVTPNDMRITAVCEHTKALFKLDYKVMRSGKVLVSTYFPSFADILKQHHAKTLAFEQAALRAYDEHDHGHDHGHRAPEKLVPPEEMTYETPVIVPGGSEDSFGILRIQTVQLPSIAFLVVKWQHEGTLLDGQVAIRPAPGSSLNLMKAAEAMLDRGGSAVGFASPVPPPRKSRSSPRMGSSPGDDDDFGGTPRGVQFRSQARLVDASPAKVLPEHDRDGGSQASGDTGKSIGILRRRLEASSEHSQVVSRLRRSLLIIFGCINLVLIANIIAQELLVPMYMATLDAVEHSSNREVELQHTLRYSQDLWLHAVGAARLAKDPWAASRQGLLDAVDQVEYWHQLLYGLLQPQDTTLIRMYQAPTTAVQTLDVRGVVRTETLPFFNAGLDLVARARLAAELPAASFTLRDASVFYLLENGPTVIQQISNTSTMIMQDMSDSLFGVWQWAILAAMGFIVLLSLIISCILIAPAMIHMEKTKHSTLQTFLAVPLPILRVLRRQSEVWLDAARKQEEEEDDDGRGLLNDEDAPDVETLAEALQSMRVIASEKRTFRTNSKSRWVQVLRVTLPVVISVLALVGLLEWVREDASAMQRSGHEFLITHTLQLFPQKAHYWLRFAQGTHNVTEAQPALALARQYLVTAQAWEHAMLFGGMDRNGVAVNSALLNPTMVDLVMQDGCSNVIETYSLANCSTFYHGLFNSGVHAALAEFIRLSQLIAQEVELGWSKSPAFNLTRSQAWLSSPSAAATNTMAHSYLASALHEMGDFMFDVTDTFASSFNTKLISFTATFVGVTMLIYVFYYRQLLMEIDTELRRSRAMVLLFPDQVVRNIPAVSEMVKKMMM